MDQPPLLRHQEDYMNEDEDIMTQGTSPPRPLQTKEEYIEMVMAHPLLKDVKETLLNTNYADRWVMATLFLGYVFDYIRMEAIRHPMVVGFYVRQISLTMETDVFNYISHLLTLDSDATLRQNYLWQSRKISAELGVRRRD